MQYGFVVPGGDIQTNGDFAVEAEEAGWDGIFIADAIAITTEAGPFPFYDPWIMLAVMAMRTERIRLGPMITAVPRRRPWKLAQETVTLDHLSKGRLIFAAGLGAAKDDGGFCKVGEAMDLKVRAKRLDEGLEILNGLWSGQPFTFSGEHYNVDAMTMAPSPVQTPRIPIWVVGVWSKEKSMRRTLTWDGVLPQKYRSMEPITPPEIEAIKRYVAEQRPAKTPFDIIAGGETRGANHRRAVDQVKPFADAGATWWLESIWSTADLNKVHKRIKQGPPK